MGDTRQIPDQRPDNRDRRSNAQISHGAKVAEIIRRIGAAEHEIAEVLPRNITFDRFQAVIATALRHNPELLECHLPSIINAAIEAAWDQLLPDGKEGAFVVHNVKYQTKPDAWRKEAVWFPMVAGLRKKIMQSGLVSDVKTKVVYSNEPFIYEEGLNPRLEHTPILDNARRGTPVAVYAIARLRDGTDTFEVMTKGDVEAVKAEAKTKYVWSKWEGEMWRKSVLRRFRKSLPQGRDMLDAEARVMFPQFSTEPAIPHLSEDLKAPPRPTRASLPAPDVTLGDGLGWETGERERETVDRREGGGEPEERGSGARQRRDDPPREERQRRDPPAEEHRADQGKDWDAWLVALKSSIKTRSSTAKLKTLEQTEAANLDAAPDKIRDAARTALDERYDALRDLGN